MIRKLFLLAVMAVAALAMTASSASAVEPITVTNGSHVVFTGDQTLSLIAHSPMGTQVASRCDNDWEGHIASNGDVEIERVDFAATPGSVGNCATTLNDCDDAGWHGTSEETAPGVTHVVLSFCLTGTALGATPVGGDAECTLTTIKATCSDVTVANQFPPPGTGGIVPRFEIDGEVFIAPESGTLGISH